MDGSFFGVPIATDAGNSIAMDGTGLLATPTALVQLDQLSIDNQNHKSVDCSGYSSFMGGQLDDLCTDFHSRNQTIAMYSDALVTSPGRNIMREPIPGGANVAAGSELKEQFFGGIPLSSNLATLFASRSDLQENLNGLAISAAPRCPEVLRTNLASDCSNSLKSSLVCSTDRCDEMFGNIYRKGGLQSIPAHVDFDAVRPARVGFQPCLASRNVEDGGWISGNGNGSTDNHHESRRFTNELSLSLATSQHSVVNNLSIPDQCSEIDCPTVSQHSWKETRLSLEQTSCTAKELQLSHGLHGPGHFSEGITGSRFLEVIQEILTQIASYSLENLDQVTHSTCGMKTGPSVLFSSGYHVEGGPLLLGSTEQPNMDGGFDIEVDPALQKRALEAKRRQLLTLLEVVDERYNQCLDEIHTVVSAFHAATELDPQIHTRFALQTVTFLYRSLRERISNQILAMGVHFESSSSRETQGSSETSYLQKQWTLQQLKRKDHQLWRPQRGLPERSVSVLRAWMFQNFLHPYPKDSEKHLLAIKSGLTRSQVSNWFINARVRLWKPMIEEMYAEMHKRKSRQKEEGTDSCHRRHTTLSSRHFGMNRN